ncbi:MAG: hypothetical protein EBY16_01460 [Gammaproteobacteria bacterium]|nr:hypothetical protein [Gammaproteobacteria bacterium]
MCVMPKRDPKSYLTEAEDLERQQRQGQLKIYLGAAPGVGKTYQMLSDALVKRSQGHDVVIGAVESHRRQEVESLASAFEKIPYLMIVTGEFKQYALDLDAVIKRAPGLVLVDEAAFSNPEGLRHPKRWQDILELIDKGIDVYTTLNVQHLESLNDIVSRLIGTRIRETVPDAFLERANALELIDLPSEDLILRLKQGKVYLPSEVKVAVQHFFKKNNLDILRELALRIAAERVSSELELGTLDIAEGNLSVKDDVLLALITAHPEMLKLIRTAKRIASRLNCPWHALYVDSGNKAEYFETQQYLLFAESLGAKNAVVFASDRQKSILNYIETNGITQLVLGKSNRLFAPWFGLGQYLVSHISDVSIHFIALEIAKVKKKWRKNITAKNILWTILLVFLAGTMIALKHMFSPWDFAWLIGLFILAMAYFGAWRWGFFLMFLFLGLDVLLNQQSNALLLRDKWAWLSRYGSWSVLYLSLSGFIIHARREVLVAREIENNHQIIVGFYQEISNLRGMSKILQAAGDYLQKDFGCDIQIYIAYGKSLDLMFPTQTTFVINPKEQGVMQWVYESAKPAGKGTDNLNFSNSLYLPLLSGGRCLGVIGLQMHDHAEILPSQKKMLMICLQQLANIIDVENQVLDEKQEKIREVKQEIKDHFLKGFVVQIYQPLLHFVDMLKTSKAAPKFIDELKLIQGHIEALKYFSDPETYQEKVEIDFATWFNELIFTLKTTWKCQHISIQETKLIDKVLLHQALMSICFQHLFSEIQYVLNPTDEIKLRYYAQDEYLILEVQLENVNKKVFSIIDKINQKVKITDMFKGFSLCHQILNWHGASLKAKDNLAQGVLIEIVLPFVKLLEI